MQTIRRGLPPVFVDETAKLQTIRRGAIFVDETASIAYSLSLAEGTYSLTGEAAALKSGSRLSAAHGTYALAGEAASLSHGFSMKASEGSYTLIGKPAILGRGRGLSAAQGAYTLTGEDAAFHSVRSLLAARGLYALTGEPVRFGSDRILPASFGVYNLAGIQALLVKASNGIGFSIGQDFPTYEANGRTMAGYLIGNEVTIPVQFYTAGGTPLNPTVVTLTLQDPLGNITTPTFSNLGPGRYSANVVPTAAGVWRWRYQGQGSVNAALESRFTVYESQMAVS